jgi:hypothetical protein
MSGRSVVDLSERVRGFPDFCPCCGDPFRDGTASMQVSTSWNGGGTTYTQTYDVRCCKACDEYRQRMIGVNAMVGLAALVWVGIVMYQTSQPYGETSTLVRLLGAGIAACWVLAHLFYVRPARKDTYRSAGVEFKHRWNGQVRFRFAHHHYAEAFHRLNGGTLR